MTGRQWQWFALLLAIGVVLFFAEVAWLTAPARQP